ncbi:CBS domain-containing protein [Pseudoxanthomonas mexicana]|uniref:CBS domain-containing protein n=1 Tax=Pseudoxanthomonas mexicana TaxID=128785 RepID=UPI00398A7DE5
MRTVRQLLGDKSPEIFTVSPDDSVLVAINEMAARAIGALLVMQDGVLEGIVSERDYARKIILHGRSSAGTQVREIMTADVITVGPDDTVDRCMQVVTGHRIRHLPVVDAGTVIGVISIGDLVKAVIEDQQVELDQLQRYIAS